MIHPTPRRGSTGSPRSRRHGSTWLVIGACLLASIGLTFGGVTKSGATEPTVKTTAKVSADSTLTVLQSAQANSFAYDGGDDTSNEDTELSANTMGNLIRYTYTGNTQDWNSFQPELAKSWSVSSNGLVYTFDLKQGVFGVSGNQFTAADVVYSFQRKFATATSSDTFLFSEVMAQPLINDVQEVNPHTVSFTIESAGYGQWFLGLMANEMGDIYDSAVLKANATPGDPYAVVWSESHGGWGLGAYDVTAEVPGQSITLTANPNYVLGKVRFQKINIETVGDPGTEVELLQSGAADIAEDLSPAEQAQLTTQSDIYVPKVKYPDTYLSVADVVTQAPFNNVKVRQAWRYAIPYKQIIDDVYPGVGVATAGPLDPNEKNYDPKGLSPNTYDPTKARKLLAAAGYPQGLTFTLTYSAGVPDVDEAAALIQSYAAVAGFTVQLNQLSTAGFATVKNAHTAQALLLDDRGFVQTPNYLLTTFWGNPEGRLSYGAYQDPGFDALLATANSFADPYSVAAGKEWNLLQKYLQTQSPSQLIAKIQASVALRSSITGYEYRSDNGLDYSMMK
jgi:peptide/nickel transport system substrate-binding protein